PPAPRGRRRRPPRVHRATLPVAGKTRRRLPRVGRTASSAGRRLVAEHLRDQEGQLQRLLRVQTRVAGGLVTARQVDIGDGHGAAEALGDVLTGQLDVDATRVGAQRTVDLEEALDLIDDFVEVTGLVAVRRGEGVAVHRVRLPDDLVAGGLDSLDDRRQRGADLVVAHACHHGQTARLLVRIQLRGIRDSLLRGDGRADLDADRVRDDRGEVDVEVLDAAGTLTD